MNKISEFTLSILRREDVTPSLLIKIFNIENSAQELADNIIYILQDCIELPEHSLKNLADLVIAALDYILHMPDNVKSDNYIKNYKRLFDLLIEIDEKEKANELREKLKECSIYI